MNATIPLLAIVAGAALAYLAKLGSLPAALGQYVAVASLAGLDTLFGGLRSGLEGKFKTDVFLNGFASNAAIAIGMTWLGEKIFADLYLAVALVLGTRIFSNLTLIRRHYAQAAMDKKERQKMRDAIAAIPEAGG